MTFTALKEKLHAYIEHADEKKVKAIYTLIEDEIGKGAHIYDEETINILEERREEYRKGKVKGHTVTESLDYIKSELKKRGL